MNERFLYAASIAYCLFAGWVIATYARAEVLATTVVIVLIAAGLAKTVTRNLAWHDDVTLALTDVQTSTGSARAHVVAGYAWLQLADRDASADGRTRDVDRALAELRAALRIHPAYFEAVNMMAYALAQSGKYPDALDFYARCLERKPGDRDLLANVEYVAQQAQARGDSRTAIRGYEMMLAQQPTAAVYGALAEIYGRDVGDLAKARALLESGLRLAPDDVEILTKLGVVAGMSGDSERAVALFDTAIARDPRNATLYVDRAMALRQLGRVAEADDAMTRARELDPTIGVPR
jgi:tetratricopeptide (TPR) repeat protein